MTPIRKLLCRLPSLRRKRSSRRRSSGPSVVQGDTHTTPASSDFFGGSQVLSDAGNFGVASSLQSTSASSFGHPHASHCSNGLTQLKRAQLAIQQYDQDHDAIVVSTLPCYPFCCHEDLLMMSRPRLLQTAYLFNSCLPFTARFTDLELSSDAHIRRRIEALVGIVLNSSEPSENDIKAISESLEQCELNNDMEITRTSNPLATHPARRNSGVFRNPRFLDVLVEEDEDEDDFEFSSHRRTLKKRRVDITRAKHSRVSFDHRSCI